MLVKPYKRTDIAGIENGVEYDHSLEILRILEFSQQDQGWLIEILQGTMITKDREPQRGYGKRRDDHRRADTETDAM